MPLTIAPQNTLLGSSGDQQLLAPVSANQGSPTILGLQSGIAWRQYLKPASFRSARFYVDAGVRESGRRIVGHQFPKRDIPYAEDMGRRSREFTVRGYCIVYPRDEGDVLKKKNYIPARNALIVALETDGPATLQLPLLGSMNVACVRFRVTEEDRFGGYCVFDMTFTEYGQAPGAGSRQSATDVQSAAEDLGGTTTNGIESGIKAITDGSPTATETSA